VVTFGWEQYPGLVPDEELTATAVQLVASRLIEEYLRQTKGKKETK